MTQIFPFPGIRYNSEKIDNLAAVISQPYDKITSEDRHTLWKRHEHNVVRLILPPPDGVETDFATESTDTKSADWYGCAADRFQSWMKSDLLLTDSPRLYVYRQTFTYQDRSYTRVGLFVALQLSDQDGPLAHEHTFEGPKADRLRLICATQANLCPIFLLADGDMGSWSDTLSQTHETVFCFDDFEGQRHELLSIDDPATLQAVQNFIQKRTLVIADGHHRYETAKNYKRKMMQEGGGPPENQPWGKVMALIVPAESPDLLVLPTHRVISQMPEGWLEQFRNQATLYGILEELPPYTGASIRQLLAQPEHQRSIVVAAAHTAFLFMLHPDAEPPALKALPEPLRPLNVSILHQFILESCLNLTPTALLGITRYIRDEEDALERVQSNTAQAAFLLGGLSPKTVLEVSQHHVRMPQKSTDFYPKIPTGLLFRSVVDQE